MWLWPLATALRDEHTVGVGGQPDVILSDEQFQAESERREEKGELSFFAPGDQHRQHVGLPGGMGVSVELPSGNHVFLCEFGHH